MWRIKTTHADYFKSSVGSEVSYGLFGSSDWTIPEKHLGCLPGSLSSGGVCGEGSASKASQSAGRIYFFLGMRDMASLWLLVDSGPGDFLQFLEAALNSLPCGFSNIVTLSR